MSLQAQLAVGSQGLPVLCAVIKEDRADLEMLRIALECLQITIGHPASNLKGPGKVPANAVSTFCDDVDCRHLGLHCNSLVDDHVLCSLMVNAMIALLPTALLYALL